MDDREPKHEWERGWDGHSKAQLQRLAKLSLAERLRWLEEAQFVMERLKISRPRIEPSGPERSPESESE